MAEVDTEPAFSTVDGLRVSASEVWQAIVGEETSADFYWPGHGDAEAQARLHCADPDMRDSICMLGISDEDAIAALAWCIRRDFPGGFCEDCDWDGLVEEATEVVEVQCPTCSQMFTLHLCAKCAESTRVCAVHLPECLTCDDCSRAGFPEWQRR